MANAIPPGVVAISIADGFGHCWGINGMLYIAVLALLPGLLSYLYANLTGSNSLTLADSRVRGDELFHDGLLLLQRITLKDEGLWQQEADLSQQLWRQRIEGIGACNFQPF